VSEFDEIRARLVADAITGCQEAAGDTGAMVRAVSRLRAFTVGETTMGKAARIESEGMSMVYGGGGTVRSNAGVGRRGQGRTLTKAEAKKLMRQQVAKERKAATRKQNAAAKRVAKAQARARRS